MKKRNRNLWMSIVSILLIISWLVYALALMLFVFLTSTDGKFFELVYTFLNLERSGVSILVLKILVYAVAVIPMIVWYALGSILEHKTGLIFNGRRYFNRYVWRIRTGWDKKSDSRH